MNEITKNAMLNRWQRMAEANATGALDIYQFLKGAIEYADSANGTTADPWEETNYCNNAFSDIMEPLLNGFKAGNESGLTTGTFNIWHTHGVKCAEFSEVAFEDLEQYIFNSRVGSYLYAGMSGVPTYKEVWEGMNRVAPQKKRRTRKSA